MIERAEDMHRRIKCKKCEKVLSSASAYHPIFEEYIVPELERYDPRDDIEKDKKLICNPTGILL